jgi:glycosyltransferase involved in cell wall biosynthesis
MPELAVSMPAHNTAPFVETAVRSVLAQRGVDFELVVVDDGSTDGTTQRVERLAASLGDSRLCFLRNESRRGIGSSHNRILNETDSQYVAHVDSDDLVRPGAFRTLRDRMTRSPDVGQVYCNFYEFRSGEPLSRGDIRAQRQSASKRATLDVRRALILHGMVANHLRFYRREALQAAGPFNEDLRYGVDLEMALRIADRSRLELEPRFLYCRRLHATNTSGLGSLARLRFWRTRLHICRRLLEERNGKLLGYDEREVVALLMLGGVFATGLPDAVKRVLPRAFMP